MNRQFRVVASQDANGRKPKIFVRRDATAAVARARIWLSHGYKNVRIIDDEGKIYTKSLFDELNRAKAPAHQPAALRPQLSG